MSIGKLIVAAILSATVIFTGFMIFGALKLMFLTINLWTIPVVIVFLILVVIFYRRTEL